MMSLAAVVFVMACSMMGTPVKINKSAAPLLAAGLMWTLYSTIKATRLSILRWVIGFVTMKGE